MKKILSLLFAIVMAVGATAQTVTYDFTSIEGFDQWKAGSYAENTINYPDAVVTFSNGSRQTGTITNMPVCKGGEMIVKLTDQTKAVTALTFTCKQWTTKTQTITLNVSTDGGVTFTATDVKSSAFVVDAKTLDAGVNAVKFTFSNSSNQIGIESLTMTLGENTADAVPAESVSITDAEGNALGYYINLVKTDTYQLKAVVAPANATNKHVTWEAIQDDAVISIDQTGLVKALAPGKAAVVATTQDGEYQAMVYVMVSEPEASTIADFIANKGGGCLLTGVVSKIVMDKNDDTKQNVYGNFNLTDATGTIYVYGCLTPAGEAKKFDTLGVNEGDEITVLASTYQLFNTTHEAVNVVFVENHGVPAPAADVTFDIVADATTFTVTPSDLEATYYIGIVPAEYDEATITEALDAQFEDMGKGLEYFSGVQTQSYEDDWYIDEAGDYIIVVCAVSDDYKRIGDCTFKTFTFGAEEPAPALTIKASADAENISIEVSDEEATYFYALLDKATVNYWTSIGLNTNELLLAAYMDMKDIESNDDLFQGSVSVATAELELEEDDYVFIVGGVKFVDGEKVFTTEAQRFDFTIGGTDTPDVPDTPSDVTFDIVADATTFTVTPSDLEATYYIEIVPAEYDEATITEALDAQFEDMGKGLEYFSGVQTQSYEDDWYVDEAGDYIIVVCAVSDDYKRIGDCTFKAFHYEPASDAGIRGITLNGTATAYSLAGRRIPAAHHGVSVMKGRKAIMK